MNQPSKPVLFVVAMFFSLGAFGVWQVVRGGDRSSDPTLGLEQKLDEAESALTKLRDQVATYETLATRTAALEERLDAMDARPVALSLAAYPIPDEVVFCGERIPLEIPEIHRRYEDEWNRFLVNRHWLISWMRRSREAYPIVEAKLVAAGLPTDLKYVMTIESAIDARATSSAGE